MSTRWVYSLMGAVVLGCILYACGPQQPATDVPITTSSDEARQLFLQGRDKIENMEVAKAAALFDQAIQKDSNFALARAYRSVSGGGAAGALENRNKALALMSAVTPGEQLTIRFLIAQSTQQSAEAKHCVDSLLVAFPQDKRAQLFCGAYYRGLGDFKTAVSYYEKAVALDSTYAPPYNLLGYDNTFLGNTDAAEKAFKTYIRLQPTLANPLDSYAEFLRLHGRYDESIAQYKKVLEMDPSFVNSISGIGDCYLCRGDAEQARHYYLEFIGKAPLVGDKLAGHYSLAAAHVSEGNIAEAVKALESRRQFAVAQNQHNAAIYSVAYQGYLLSAFGKPQEGIKKYNEAIAIAKMANIPERARENALFWSNYWLAYAYLEANNISRAKEFLAAFSKEVESRGNPGESNAVTTAKAYLALKQGRYNECISSLTSLPDDPFKYYALALAYAKTGNKESAARMIEKLRRWEAVSLDNAVNLRLASALAKI